MVLLIFVINLLNQGIYFPRIFLEFSNLSLNKKKNKKLYIVNKYLLKKNKEKFFYFSKYYSIFFQEFSKNFLIF